MPSTTTALLKFTDDWHSGLDLGEYVRVVYFDLKKALDTVDHKILLPTLAHYGIQSQELLWFKSGLSNAWPATLSPVARVEIKVAEKLSQNSACFSL